MKRLLVLAVAALTGCGVHAPGPLPGMDVAVERPDATPLAYDVPVTTAGASAAPANHDGRGGEGIVSPAVYLWCGLRPDDPEFDARTAGYVAAGVTATMGPCETPPADYTPAHPGSRYAPRKVYARLVERNATHGLRTIVYDPWFWEDPTAAAQFWAPHLANIEAVDLGDEVDPNWVEQWEVLVERWATVRSTSSIPPYTNHLRWAIADAIADLPGGLLSFDQYDGDQGVELARQFAPGRRLMCAVNALEHGPFVPTPATVADTMTRLGAAGCSDWLIFGGKVYAPGFGPDLVAGLLGPSIAAHVGSAA